MRFSRYFFLLLACLAASTFLLPRLYHLPFPSQPGPAFDDKTRPSLVKILQKNDIQLALIGDSVLQEGVDPQALSAALEVPAHSIAVPGSTSPFWYLILKNIVLQMDPPPPVVVVLFRDTILTLPNYHVNGGYVNELDQWAAAHEDLLIQRAYLNFMNPLEKWALTWLPLYGARQRLTDAADFVSRNASPIYSRPAAATVLPRPRPTSFTLTMSNRPCNSAPLWRRNSFSTRPRPWTSTIGWTVPSSRR